MQNRAVNLKNDIALNILMKVNQPNPFSKDWYVQVCSLKKHSDTVISERNLMLCVLSDNAESLVTYSTPEEDGDDPGYLNYKIYQLKPFKLLAVGYINTTGNRLVLDEHSFRASATIFSSNNSAVYTGSFNTSSVNSPSPDCLLYDIRHPKVYFSDRPEAIIQWIKKQGTTAEETDRINNILRNKSFFRMLVN
jgi:hypothetical protein